MAKGEDTKKATGGASKGASRKARTARLAGMALSVGVMLIILSVQRDWPWAMWVSPFFFLMAGFHFYQGVLLARQQSE